MKKISISDLMTLEEFKELKNEASFLPITVDKLVLKTLHTLGLDKHKGYKIVAENHRNLQGKVLTGYVYIGEIRNDKEYLNSPFCTAEERIIATSTKDFSLTQELLKMSWGNSDYGSFQEEIDDDGKPAKASPALKENFEDNWEDHSKYIETLQQIVENVRGCSMGEDGSLKTHKEWLATLKA